MAAAGQRQKVQAGGRLDFEDGLTLIESDDVLELHEARRSRRGRAAATTRCSSSENLYLNQTNVCRVKYKFCAFAITHKATGRVRTSRRSSSRTRVRQRELTGFTEIHMVNGDHHVDLDCYVDRVRALHEAITDMHLKLSTASEIHHMSKLAGLAHESMSYGELRAAGLGSLPGGGEEVFADRVRGLIAPGKGNPRMVPYPRDGPRLGDSRPNARCCTATSRRRRSGSTTSSPARGAGRDGRLSRLHPARLPPREHRSSSATAGTYADRSRGPQDDRRLTSHARQYPHVKAYWIMMGCRWPGALHFGADDVGDGRARGDLPRQGAHGTSKRSSRPVHPRSGPDSDPERHALQRGEALVSGSRTTPAVSVPRGRRRRLRPAHALRTGPLYRVLIRLSRISYVNMAPVFYRLDANVEEVQGVPTELQP